MKENNQIYLSYKFHWRPQSALGDSQFFNKKMKTLFLLNMSKSGRLTSTFFRLKGQSLCLKLPKMTKCKLLYPYRIVHIKTDLSSFPSSFFPISHLPFIFSPLPWFLCLSLSDVCLSSSPFTCSSPLYKNSGSFISSPSHLFEFSFLSVSPSCDLCPVNTNCLRSSVFIHLSLESIHSILLS